MDIVTESTKKIYEVYLSGDVIRAEIGIRNALQQWPNEPNFLRLGALTALAINQTVVAHQRLDKAIELTPLTAEIENLRGNIFKASADWACAEAAYNSATSLDPTYGPLKGNQLDLYLQSGQPRRVLHLLNSEHNFGEMGEFAKSQALTNLGQYHEALLVIEKAKHLQYTDQFKLQKIRCLSALSELEAMLAEFESLSLSSPFSADSFDVCVNAFAMHGQQNRAIKLIKKVSNQEDSSAKLLVRVIRTLRRFDMQDEAQHLLIERHANNKDDPDLIAELASSQCTAGQNKNACELYLKALKLRPGDLSLLMGYAQAALLDKQYSAAENAIQGARMQAPNNQFLLALTATLRRSTRQNHESLYDYESFVKVYDLEPPAGYQDIVSFNLDLKAALDRFHVYSGTPTNQSLRNGTQTHIDLSLIQDHTIQAFFNMLDLPISNYLEQLGFDQDHPLRRRNTGKYRINGAWSVRLQPNGYHVNHVHPMGWLSSSYYVDIPNSIGNESKQGWIKFGEPGLKLDQPAEFHVQPKVGRLVLFPSYMWHGTIPFAGDQSRLTLPFDVVPA
ncbi:MAG: tetratricopeptide repeat protein [Acidiferrobacterales bacterium]|nr:tetratricopeptide repeat protein [Acidiferrobacterales bacterium]